VPRSPPITVRADEFRRWDTSGLVYPVRLRSKTFDATTHEWYPAYEFLRLTVPTGAEPALEEYRQAFGAFTSIVQNWKDAYIDGRELAVDIETGEDSPASIPVPTPKVMLQQNYDNCGDSNWPYTQNVTRLLRS
jgi:hypothetical protein